MLEGAACCTDNHAITSGFKIIFDPLVHVDDIRYLLHVDTTSTHPQHLSPKAKGIVSREAEGEGKFNPMYSGLRCQLRKVGKTTGDAYLFA